MLLRQTLLNSTSSLNHANQHRYKPCVKPAGRSNASRISRQQEAPHRQAACHASVSNEGKDSATDPFQDEDFQLFMELMEEAVQPELPTAEQESVQGIYSRMEAAEATQQQLMASGRLADAIAGGNQLLGDLLQAYSTLQKLYHKGYRHYLERYQQLAVSPAGKEACPATAAAVVFSADRGVCIECVRASCNS